MLEQQPSDQDLITAIQWGDGDAFETLYYRYRDWVTSLAFRYCGNESDALDVLQETFMYVSKKMKGFELRAQFKTFLYPVVKHIALSKKSASRKHVALPDTGVIDLPAKDETDTNIYEYVKFLPEEQAEVLMLRFVDGFALKEIATSIDIPLGTVKSRLHVALQTLKEKIKKRPFE